MKRKVTRWKWYTVSNGCGRHRPSEHDWEMVEQHWRECPCGEGQVYERVTPITRRKGAR